MLGEDGVLRQSDLLLKILAPLRHVYIDFIFFFVVLKCSMIFRMLHTSLLGLLRLAVQIVRFVVCLYCCMNESPIRSMRSFSVILCMLDSFMSAWACDKQVFAKSSVFTSNCIEVLELLLL